MNRYHYKYRADGIAEWIEFGSWSPPGTAAGLIAQEAAQDYWNKHQPPEADMWPLDFEIEGRGTFLVDVEAEPVFIAQRKIPAMTPPPPPRERK